MSFIRCHFCKRTALWRHPSTGYQVCSECKAWAEAGAWEDLAREWLKWYPDEWVPDVAAYMQMAFERVDFNEKTTPLFLCEGCDGSICGNAHRHGRVLEVLTVVASNPKDAFRPKPD